MTVLRRLCQILRGPPSPEANKVVPGRAAVLLGSGASVSAGLPTSPKLTEAVHSSLADNGDDQQAAAFDHIVQLLDASGRNTDIEAVYEFAQRLLDTSGLPNVLKSTLPSAEHLRALVGDHPDLRNPSPLEQGHPGLIRRVVVALLRSDPSKASYLEPLFDLANDTGLDIGTLNYDLTVEHAAKARGGAFKVSYAQNDPLQPLGHIRLWKLHGSLDWSWRTEAPANPGSPPRWTVYRPACDADRAIIFGAGNKLTPHGPFLRLLNAWEDRLNQADHLLIVGYSFADHHLNEVLTRWCWSDPGRRTITVVTWKGRSRSDPPFLKQLRIYLNGDTRAGGPFIPPDGTDRLRVFRGGAAADLPSAVELVAGLCAKELPPATPAHPRPVTFRARVGAQTLHTEYDRRME